MDGTDPLPVEGELWRRVAERHNVDMPAEYRFRWGVACTSVIVNISPQGCCIGPVQPGLEPGMIITVRPEGLELLEGRVRWVRNFQAGIRFDRPLYGPVVEHLARLHGRPVHYVAFDRRPGDTKGGAPCSGS